MKEEQQLLKEAPAWAQSQPHSKENKINKKVAEATVSKEHNTAFLKTRLKYLTDNR